MVKVLGWHPVMGRALPDPVIEDDSDRFSPEVVKNVRAWLERSKAQFAVEGPTPTVIQLTNEVFHPWLVITTVGEGVREETRFKHATIELHLRDNISKIVVAKYHYLVGRTPDNRFDILGPQLKIDQVSLIC